MQYPYTLNPFEEQLEEASKEDVSIEEQSTEVIEKQLAKLREIVQTSEVRVKKPAKRKQPKKFRRGQVWTVKKSYIDGEGDQVETSHLFIVMIMTKPFLYNDKIMLRAANISPYIQFSKIEMSELDDIVVLNKSLFGMEFMIEPWNERPICADILNEYKFSYNLKKHVQPDYDMFDNMYGWSTDADKEKFRKTELKNARYLSWSSWSHLK